MDLRNTKSDITLDKAMETRQEEEPSRGSSELGCADPHKNVRNIGGFVYTLATSHTKIGMAVLFIALGALAVYMGLLGTRADSMPTSAEDGVAYFSRESTVNDLPALIEGEDSIVEARFVVQNRNSGPLIDVSIQGQEPDRQYIHTKIDLETDCLAQTHLAFPVVILRKAPNKSGKDGP